MNHSAYDTENKCVVNAEDCNSNNYKGRYICNVCRNYNIEVPVLLVKNKRHFFRNYPHLAEKHHKSCDFNNEYIYLNVNGDKQIKELNIEDLINKISIKKKPLNKTNNNKTIIRYDSKYSSINSISRLYKECSSKKNKYDYITENCKLSDICINGITLKYDHRINDKSLLFIGNVYKCDEKTNTIRARCHSSYRKFHKNVHIKINTKKEYKDICKMLENKSHEGIDVKIAVLASFIEYEDKPFVIAHTYINARQIYIP